jgi:hypothetical protein
MPSFAPPKMMKGPAILLVIMHVRLKPVNSCVISFHHPKTDGQGTASDWIRALFSATVVSGHLPGTLISKIQSFAHTQQTEEDESERPAASLADSRMWDAAAAADPDFYASGGGTTNEWTSVELSRFHVLDLDLHGRIC